jgi:S-adenosylmethionine hydrolase
MPPILAFLSDFGLGDYYVGAMKGVALTICPEASLVDIVHEIPPHDIEAGALALAAAYRAFPGGTVFVAVVDPGVGSARRPLGVDLDGYRFVGPDNGIFTFVLRRGGVARVREITATHLLRPDVSPVFHGRDVFSPVAAHLAAGMAFEELGPSVADPVLLPFAGSRRLPDGTLEGRVIHLDRFGNLVTSISGAELTAMLEASAASAGDVVAEIGGARVALARTYSDVADEEGLALVASSGFVEVAVNGGSAARRLGAKKGSRVQLRLVRPRGPSSGVGEEPW